MPIRPRLLNQQIYEHLKQQIFDQVLAPREKLPIDLLARQLGCGISVVRESLFQLASERLLVYHPNRGFSISPLLDRRAVEELYAVRHLLEPVAVRWAAAAMSASKIEQLQETLDQMLRCSGDPMYKDYKEFQEADARFHDLIFAFSDNSTLRRMYDSLHVHLHMARFYPVLQIVDVRLGCKEHAEIIEALARGDADDAYRAMDHHLDKSWERFLPALEPTPVLNE